MGTATAAVLVALAVVVFGLDPLMTIVAFLVVALGGTLWLLAEMRAERKRLALEVVDLETSALLLAERLRVAREVHDLVSHGLGMITVRASSTLHLAQQDGKSTLTEREQVLVKALSDIEATSREATSGLRRTIQALRAPEESATLQPTENLTALPEIIAQAHSAGLTVGIRHGDLGDIPISLQGAIVALIREGVANSARHAGPTNVAIELDHDESVTVSIHDAGPTPAWSAQPGSGHGLLGLRERIESLGGTLHAGPHCSGTGYELRAVFEVDR